MPPEPPPAPLEPSESSLAPEPPEPPPVPPEPPSDPEAPGAVPIAPHRRRGGGGGGDEHWLLVDADALDADPLVRYFADEDINLETADNAARGLAAAQDDVPRVIIVDVELPDQHGFELVLELRAALGRRVPLIALIDPRRRDEIRNCLRAGFDDYLTKPLTRSGLRNLAERLVELGRRLLSDSGG